MLSLREIVQRYAADERNAMRKAIGLPAGADDTRLLQRLDNSDRTRKLFATLDATEKNVLRFVLSQGGRAAEQEILDLYPEALPAVGKLREHYLLFQDAAHEGMVMVPREYLRYVPLTPAEKSTLANLAARQPAAFFTRVAQLTGGDSVDRRAVLEALRKRWLNEVELRSTLETLPDPMKALWRLFVESEGIVDTKVLQRAGVDHPNVQPGHLNLEQPLDHLYALGLVYPNQLPVPTCFLAPTDVLATLRGRAAAKVFTTEGQTPAHLRTWGLRILSDLQLFAGLQTSGRMQFTQNEIPLRHQLKGFLRAIGIDDELYGLFLNRSFEAFFVQAVKQATNILDANPAESMSRLIVHWRDNDAWQESAQYRDARRSPDGQTDRTLKSKRLILLKALEDLPTKQWVPYAEFEQHVFGAGWKRVETGIQSATAYYHNERWPRRAFEPDHNPQETLAVMTAEPLVWLGLLDVGVKKSKKTGWDLSHVRLTEWGRQYVDKKSGRFEPLPPVPAETKFRVLPNADISVSPKLRPDLLTKLFKIAELKGVNAFHLTKESLREALDEGQNAKEILDFLRENSTHELPSLVTEFVEEVGQKHGHIKLGMVGAYLQVDDPLLLVELRAQKSLQDIFKKQVGDRLVTLTDTDLDRIAKVLRKLGYFPVVEKSEETERLKLRYHW